MTARSDETQLSQFDDWVALQVRRTESATAPSTRSIASGLSQISLASTSIAAFAFSTPPIASASFLA